MNDEPKAQPRSPLIVHLFAFIVLLLGAGIARAEETAPLVPSDLFILSSQHYRIHTDLEDTFSRDLAARLDLMYEEYARRLEDFRTASDGKTFEAFLFRRRSDYVQFVGDRYSHTDGVFMAGRNCLAGVLEGAGRDTLRHTLQHEAFHQFAFTAIGPRIPVWLNEGMAQFFEEGIWTGNAFILSQVPPRRVRQLNDDMDNRHLLKFRTLMTWTPQQWADNLPDESLAVTQYNQAWAMVHFLVNYSEAGGHPYRTRLLRMLKFIHDGEDGDHAFRMAFSDNIEGFQEKFVDYAARLMPTREATLIEHQEVLADLLRELRNHGRMFNDLAAFKMAVIRGNYRITYTKANLKWTTDANPATYFADLEGRPYGPNDLYFFLRREAVLPDIVCRAEPTMQFRTRFYHAEDTLEHELLIEAPSQQ